MTDGASPKELRPRFDAIRDEAFDRLASGEATVKTRFQKNVMLATRLSYAIGLVHEALAEMPSFGARSRRFVLVKERAGMPTLLHASRGTTAIAHVGLGPAWVEIPSIYLGLNLFDILLFERRQGGRGFFQAFKLLLEVEERAIQTGYAHTEKLSAEQEQMLIELTEAVLTAYVIEEPYAPRLRKPKAAPAFTADHRLRYLKLLDARSPEDAGDFDHRKNLAAVKSLARLARRYKRAGELESLLEVVRLLVAASGHDVHDVRSRCNILLERVLSPKEFDAPLARRFVNVRRGTEHHFHFQLPPRREYFLRIYRSGTDSEINLETEMDYQDLPLSFDPEIGGFGSCYRFDDLGHFDYLVYRRVGGSSQWLTAEDSSGRINVLPDIRGEIVLEIFTDIHGHTRMFWKDEAGHPGMVYNENGEIIRLGRFSDVTAHLADFKERYRITGIYLLGVQKRGVNREDWAPEATSPSPFSPMDLTTVEPFLGGREELQELVREAHALDIRVFVDIIPHVNRQSTAVSESWVVKCYDDAGILVPRAATDGHYGSWNDGKLLNYRKLEVWRWLALSVQNLLEDLDVDGIRFDSAHAVPIMMKKNNYPFFYGTHRTAEDMVEGTIVVNDREGDHFTTTGYYDSASRDVIACPLHTYLMLSAERVVRRTGKPYFLHIAECYWGRERYLSRSGIVPYNSALFKICESIMHGMTDVREIYHLYDRYYAYALPPGTEMLGILGNHDERRALNTFGSQGLRAAGYLTVFMSSIIMDYEGSAEGQSWKVYLDNIYVNWNQFESVSNPGVAEFYRELYAFHAKKRRAGRLIWANNDLVAAAVVELAGSLWIGAFNFSDTNQPAALQFDRPELPIEEEGFYRIVDPIYSSVTSRYAYYTGRELAVSKIHTVVPYSDRVKILRIEKVRQPHELYEEFLRDSFLRLCTAEEREHLAAGFAFREIASHAGRFEDLVTFVDAVLLPLFSSNQRGLLELGLKRALFYVFRSGDITAEQLLGYLRRLSVQDKPELRRIGENLLGQNRRGSLIFLSAEAEPFSKSGGLATVVYELPRQLAALGEKAFVVTPLYSHGYEKARETMRRAVESYGISYTGRTVRFRVMDREYEVGVHYGMVDGVGYYLLHHHELFDGLYWGYTSEEKLRRRVGFSRACAELIRSFDLSPTAVFTNDAFAGLFHGIVRGDPVYAEDPVFRDASLLQIVHNAGWQYFDAYHRFEDGRDLFGLFDLPDDRAAGFTDPTNAERINCLAAGIRSCDQVVTVSPAYARQIGVAADGLEGLLHGVVGINNAIGGDFAARAKRRFRESSFVEQNTPALERRIAEDAVLRGKLRERYPELLEGPEELRGMQPCLRKEALLRMRNKLLLQVERGLAVDPDKILAAMIHRVCEQKGFHLVLKASEGIFGSLGFQAVLGGAVASGDRAGQELAQGLLNLQQYYPREVSAGIGYQDVTAPLFCADVFLMPSMYEPGGISQLEAFACGCLVVARATGGLRDTVIPIRVRGREVAGNGFLFADFTPESFYDAMRRCADFFRATDERTVARVRREANRSIYHWDRPARQYRDLVYGMKEIIYNP